MAAPRIDHLLEDLGLTPLEVSIYKMLLAHGPSMAGDISQKTGIHRRNVYDALERLIGKGMVGYIKENNRKIYSLADPKRILQRLEHAQREWLEVMPQILAQHAAVAERRETVFFRGTSGIRAVLEDQLEAGQEVLVHATAVSVTSVLKHYFPRYQLLRKERGIPTRMLFDESYRNPENLRKLRGIPLCGFRFIREFNRGSMSQYIYGDTVAIVVWSEQPVAIVIRQKEIAQGFRDNFELLWKMAK